MLTFFTLIFFNFEGNEYDSNEKKVLQLVEEKTTEITVLQSVESIAGGTISSSAFYLCRQKIQSVSFEQNSQLKELGILLFSETSIKSVNFSNCAYLTAISRGCFKNCRSLSEIIFPPFLVTIEAGAFSYCIFTELTFPDSLTTLATYLDPYACALGYCSSLTTIHITKNSNLSFLGQHSLFNNGLTSFFLPKNLITIEIGVFPLNPIIEFTCDSNNPCFSAEGRALYNKDGTELVCVSSYRNSQNFVVKSKVLTIKTQAFRGVSDDTIEFENQNVTIEKQAFHNSLIKNLTYLKGQNYVVSQCFYGASLLERVVLHPNIVTIQNSAFFQCTSLKEVVLFNGLTTIESSAFSQCPNIKLVIPKSVLTIGVSAFSGVDQKNVEFENKTRFYLTNNTLYCDSVLIDYFGTDPENIVQIPSSCSSFPSKMFESKLLKTLIFEEPSSVQYFGTSTFSECTIQTITFPSSLTSIGTSCFQSCSLLTTVDFYGSLTSIPDNCFNNCPNLVTIRFKPDNSINLIGSRAFYQCTNLIFNFSELKALNQIKDYAFFKTKSITVELPASLTFLGESCFAESSAKTVYFSISKPVSSLKRTMQEMNLLYSVPNKCFYKCQSLTDIFFGDSTNSTGIDSFAYCTSLVTFHLGKKISVIEQYSFAYCHNLVTVEIPDGSALSQIKGNAFYQTNLNNFDIANKEEFNFDGSLLMNGNKSKIIYYISTSPIKSFIIPETVTEIGPYSFQSASNLWEVIIPTGSLTTIKYQAFKDCFNLRRIILPDSLITIEKDAFNNCNKILCGGLVMNVSLKDQATEAGISEKAVSDGCLNNFDALIRKNTCENQNNYKIRYLSLFFVILVGHK